MYRLLFVLITCFLSLLSLSLQAEGLNQNDQSQLSVGSSANGARLAINGLSAEDKAALDQGQQIEVIVNFDWTEAVQLAELRRKQAGLTRDDDAILTEVVASLQRQKQAVFSQIPHDQLELIHDYIHSPMAFVRLQNAAGLRALLVHPKVKGVYTNRKGHLQLSESLPLIQQQQTQFQGGTGNGVTVAVLDSGVDYKNAEFFCSEPSVPSQFCKVVANLDCVSGTCVTTKDYPIIDYQIVNSNTPGLSR